MEFRVMDEAIDFEGRGLALLINEGEDDLFADGCQIRDIRGTVHVVEYVTRQGGLTCLFIRNGDARYFGRLFRDILVDATLFTLFTGEE